MRIVFLFLMCVSPALVAATEVESVEVPQRVWSVLVRAGSVLKSPDPALLSTWDHKSERSYQVGVGGFYHLAPFSFGLSFFFGSEFLYLQSREELSGASSASIDVTVYQWLVSGGLAYRPGFLGGRWGGSFATATEVWGQKSAKLNAQGFSRDLGTEKTRTGNVGMIDLSWVDIAQFSIFYDWTDRWRPILTFDSRSVGRALTLGAQYAF